MTEEWGPWPGGDHGRRAYGFYLYVEDSVGPASKPAFMWHVWADSFRFAEGTATTLTAAKKEALAAAKAEHHKRMGNLFLPGQQQEQAG